MLIDSSRKVSHVKGTPRSTRKGDAVHRFTCYVPQAKGKAPAITIADLIPVGRDNAIRRDALRSLCVHHRLVASNISDTAQDREMRNLIKIARRDYVILNLSNGKGYYRVSKEDMEDLRKYIRQETNRGKEIFRSLAMAKKLYEDYKHDRL